jgi:hypothetical protein
MMANHCEHLMKLPRAILAVYNYRSILEELLDSMTRRGVDSVELNIGMRRDACT